jgi:hypothetical protein
LKFGPLDEELASVPSFLYGEDRRITMNSYVRTISPDTSICDGRHTWGEHGMSGDSILIVTRTKTFPGESESKRQIHAVEEAVRLALAFVAFHKD